MNDDDLRQRLAALDPVAPAVSTEPFTSLRAQSLLESVMTSPTASSNRRPALLALAASVTVAAAVGGVLLLQDDSADRAPQATAPLTLALSPDDAMASCMMFSVDVLKGMSPAFGGTATDVTPTSVTIDVDRWYVGGDAETVVLTQPGGASAPALYGIAFEQGSRYLVTSENGVVNGCGYSGPATPDFEASFNEAFGGS